jgi:hypothetical protein
MIITPDLSGFIPQIAAIFWALAVGRLTRSDTRTLLVAVLAALLSADYRVVIVAVMLSGLVRVWDILLPHGGG